MLQASYYFHEFIFNFPGGTSRGVLKTKPSWMLKVWDDTKKDIVGIGEISLIPGLSPESVREVPTILDNFCKNPQYFLEHNTEELNNLPAVKFGIETALQDLNTGGEKILYPSDFTQSKVGIKINGLIWMGKQEEMLERIKEKVESGFTCLKLKVGAIDFIDELNLLKYIRRSFSADTLELRVDANGAFTHNEALQKMKQIADYNVHSIEQPIKQGNWTAMADLCAKTSLPIALDEELIGIVSIEERKKLLKEIKPQYIILKPSLIGGLNDTKEWSALAEKQNIGWWVTSALEGNIGLNAIAQWTYKYGSRMPQGLGTGQVFSNNIASPLEIRGENLYYNTENIWGK